MIWGTGAQQKIIGVISGYYTEQSEVQALVPEPHPKEPQEVVNVNSGFFIAFNISYAMDAIHSDPIGPLRKSN